ncbi:MAG: hypothetical protein QOF14_2923 [Hyphomicrobiales bacterium]|jgi:hypothetical protein|nr:hypothetical protein [Hyphomicrobiales bacterium]
MPQTHDARPSAQIIPTHPCPKCGQPMRLSIIEPHERYKNLDARTFDCDCGETLTVAIARVE